MIDRRPAVVLLLWCAREAVAAGGRDNAPLDGFDDDEWRIFVGAAVRHHVIPTARQALAGVAGVPAAAVSDLNAAFDANTVRNLRLAGELIGISRALDAAGVESVTWKGPLLAERGYGDLRMRQFFDLDLLIRPAQLQTAIDVLAGLSFQPELTLKPEQQSRYVAHMGEVEMVRASDGLWVELHTAVVPTYFGRGRGADDLWTRIESARLARAEVRALDPADEFEALCVHGSKHLWERLAWILDIAMLSRLLGPDEWERLYDGARRRGTVRMVNTAVALAIALCGGQVPVAVEAQVRSDRAARRLASVVNRALFEPAGGNRRDELRFHVQMWDRPLDRVRYLANVAFVPSVADWQFVNLPTELAPLYSLVRPLRMAFDWLRAGPSGDPVGGVHEHR